MGGELRWLYALAASLFLAACASPARITLPAASSAAGFEIVDGRAPESLASRDTDLGFTSAEYLGDERFSSPRLALLRDALQDAAAENLKGRRVVVTAFDVSLRKEGGRFRGAPGYVPSTGNLGADIVGRVLGTALIYGIESARAERSACTFIRIEVGEDNWSTGACEPTGTSNQEPALRASVMGAIKKIVDEVVAKPPRAP